MSYGGGEREAEGRGTQERAKDQACAGRHDAQALGATYEAGAGVGGGRWRGGLPGRVDGRNSTEVRASAQEAHRVAGEAHQSESASEVSRRQAAGETPRFRKP